MAPLYHRQALGAIPQAERPSCGLQAQRLLLQGWVAAPVH